MHRAGVLVAAAGAHMKLSIRSRLEYVVTGAADVLLQLEAAQTVDQDILAAWIELPPCDHFARYPGHDAIGERIWLNVSDRLIVDYQSTILIERVMAPCDQQLLVPKHQLPGDVVPYLMPSRYCPSDLFPDFVKAEFSGLSHGALAVGMRDWVHHNLKYVPGASTSQTTAIDTFVRRQGICRDYAHLLITLARAAGIPARMASVYASSVNPPDFHAVADLYIGGEWRMLDATMMADEACMARIGVGRDAADIAFLTVFGLAAMEVQHVSVEIAS